MLMGTAAVKSAVNKSLIKPGDLTHEAYDHGYGIFFRGRFIGGANLDGRASIGNMGIRLIHVAPDWDAIGAAVVKQLENDDPEGWGRFRYGIESKIQEDNSMPWYRKILTALRYLPLILKK
jgi:hypothetical protein